VQCHPAATRPTTALRRTPLSSFLIFLS
jgi:hypothetical protein